MKYLLRNTMLQVAAFLCLLTIAGPFLHGQANAGAISGTVTDSTGAAIVGAKVTITNQSTAVPYEKTTDSSGFYSVEGLTNGLYTVDVAKSGFQESVTSGIQLDPGQRRASNVVLAVGSATAQVTVEANALEVNTESSESAGTVSSSQIENLMLNGRNFETLALSIPGVSDVHGADSLGGGGLEGGTSLIVNGNSVEYSTYTIDGVYNMNSGNMAGIDITPIPDGISCATTTSTPTTTSRPAPLGSIKTSMDTPWVARSSFPNSTTRIATKRRSFSHPTNGKTSFLRP